MPSMMRAFSTKSIGADTNTEASVDGRFARIRVGPYGPDLPGVNARCAQPCSGANSSADVGDETSGRALTTTPCEHGPPRSSFLGAAERFHKILLHHLSFRELCASAQL